MTACKECGSYAINHHCHGRDGSDPDLCDVCYWQKRALNTPNQTSEPIAWAYILGTFNKKLDIKVSLDRYDVSITSPFGRQGIDYDASLGVYEMPLYTKPPTNRPLTNERIDQIADSMEGGIKGFMTYWGWRNFAKAIQAELKGELGEI